MRAQTHSLSLFKAWGAERLQAIIRSKLLEGNLSQERAAFTLQTAARCSISAEIAKAHAERMRALWVLETAVRCKVAAEEAKVYAMKLLRGTCAETLQAAFRRKQQERRVKQEEAAVLLQGALRVKYAVQVAEALVMRLRLGRSAESLQAFARRQQQDGVLRRQLSACVLQRALRCMILVEETKAYTLQLLRDWGAMTLQAASRRREVQDEERRRLFVLNRLHCAKILFPVSIRRRCAHLLQVSRNLRST